MRWLSGSVNGTSGKLAALAAVVFSSSAVGSLVLHGVTSCWFHDTYVLAAQSFLGERDVDLAESVVSYDLRHSASNGPSQLRLMIHRQVDEATWRMAEDVGRVQCISNVDVPSPKKMGDET